MKQTSSAILFLLIVTFFTTLSAQAQKESSSIERIQPALKTYLIERDIPGAGQLSPGDLKGISQKSCSAIKEMGTGISWVQSYVTSDKIFCVYRAENEMLLREHAKKGGFPISSITEISNVISPKTAD